MRISPLLMLAALVLASCDRQRLVTDAPQPPAPVLAMTRAPAADPVMGQLSLIARHIVAGLQDPDARVHLIEALKANPDQWAGLDLELCEAEGPIARVLSAGARRGGHADMCTRIRGHGGVTLYMDPNRLATWHPNIIPVVTAIANPTTPLPRRFIGYRSPERTIEIPNDGSLSGPILVILGRAHPRARPRGPARTPVQQNIEVPVPGPAPASNSQAPRNPPQ